MYPKGRAAKNRIDLTGSRFGRLEVLGESHRDGKILFWKCKCDCGVEFSARAQSLRNGVTTHCGCSVDRSGSANGNWRHGMKQSRAYNTWMAMRERCENEKSTSYKNYGDKGVSVCEEWRDFLVFYRDMGAPPKGASIERIDNSKGYSKANCKWGTRTEQNRNTSRVRRIKAHGIVMTMPEWAALSGVKYSALYKRLVTCKQLPEIAIPPKKSDGTPWSKDDEIKSKLDAERFEEI